MKKKKFTSWGVSFASLALVAGMMSYMGIKKDTTTNTTAVATTQSSQSGSTQDSSITYEVPSQSTDTTGSTNTSGSTDTCGTTDTSGTGQSDDQSVSQDNSFPSQHGGFDTTTGGT